MVYSEVDIPGMAKKIHVSLPVATAAFTTAGATVHPAFYAGAAMFGGLTVLDNYLRYGQTKSAVQRNFGLLGKVRKIIESIGPEARQYIVASDTEERPFSRRQRALIYRYAKDEKIKSVAFGTVEDLVDKPMILHSMFGPLNDEIAPFSLTFGDQKRNIVPYTINHPILPSAMSFGSLGGNAISAISHGSRMAGVPQNTGEGGISRYHLEGKCDIIFQRGTGNFGVRNLDGSFNEDKLIAIAQNEYVKMIEFKWNQGAKAVGGGFVPGCKVDEEVAAARGVPVGKDIKSPARYPECPDARSTVTHLSHMQEITGLPIGFKFCLGRPNDFEGLVDEMIEQDFFPDYFALDGAEGGTGAAPQELMDYVGMPIFPALKRVNDILIDKGVRDRTKIIASGKLVDPGSQIIAMAGGADAIYTARGVMFALGCLQAMDCNSGNCPAGITTQDPRLQRGLVVSDKADRVANYFNNLYIGLNGLLTATGHKSFGNLSLDDIADV